ncbi:hypothetical protein V9T40_012794 [Parthenolecanium corni]|uniref:Activating signal cointegrator 1 n=1 Tax=Parthenolecanium corni TaxID=536013 RepID=A0AAN9T7V6_9HEMI
MADQKLIFREWLKDKLSSIHGFPVENDYADAIMNKKTDAEVENHLKELLNYKDSRVRKFIAEVLKRRSTVHIEPHARKKVDAVEEKYHMSNQKNRPLSEKDIKFKVDKTEPEQSEENSGGKKKNKFVNFYSKDGKTVLLKGRYLCNCEAKKHQLINNCLTCGRIVCEQEGSGPCYFCGNLVCTVEEMAAFNGDTTKASKLYEQLLTKEKPKGLDEALKQRDKLLDFNQNSRKHTHVFDDDSDYFCSTNPWLTLEERDEVRKREEEFFNKKNESRRDKKITLKLEGGKITTEVEKENMVGFDEESIEKKFQAKNELSPAENRTDISSIDHLIDPYFSKFNLKFKKILPGRSVKIDDGFDMPLSHIMDPEIHKLKDEGYCLSVHQPWASFLVNGIRTVEGRTWYTPYRGKLWIASTGLRISRQDADVQENTYRIIKGDMKFPADYPAGCLLGCVDLLDCLTQEQYRSQYPDGEVEDPYVFICENPLALPVRYPVKGKPNIYKLDEKIHKAAATCLYTVDKVLSKSEHKVKSLRP